MKTSICKKYKVGQFVTIVKDYGFYQKEVNACIKKITKTHLHTTMGNVEYVIKQKIF